MSFWVCYSAWESCVGRENASKSRGATALCLFAALSCVLISTTPSRASSPPPPSPTATTSHLSPPPACRRLFLLSPLCSSQPSFSPLRLKIDRTQRIEVHRTQESRTSVRPKAQPPLASYSISASRYACLLNPPSTRSLARTSFHHHSQATTRLTPGRWMYRLEVNH